MHVQRKKKALLSIYLLVLFTILSFTYLPKLTSRLPQYTYPTNQELVLNVNKDTHNKLDSHQHYQLYLISYALITYLFLNFFTTKYYSFHKLNLTALEQSNGNYACKLVPRF